MSTILGSLANTDVANPNRPGAYSDDYGLAGLTVGEQVTLELESSTFDTYLQLVDANTGTVIAFNDDGGAGVNSELSFTVESGVEYLVRATSYGANATGQYELTSSAGELFVPSGSSTIGELSDTDVANPNRPGAYSDDYGLAGLTVGEQVTLELESSTFDTYLQLVDANTGTVIAFNDDGGAGVNSELSFTVESGVEYLVRATSYGANATGQYELTSSAGELFVPSGSSIIGELSDTDVANPNRPGAYSDDYGLAGLTVGEQVTLELESSTFDTYLQLVDANTGTVIAFNDDGGAGVNSELSFTVESGVEYLVRATSYGANATGQYELTSSAGELFVPSGSSIIGELSDTDVANPNRPGAYSDDYGLAGLTVGEQVTLELESSTFDTYLQLVDANTGTVIAFNDDGGAGVNSELSFTVESGVEYLVRATSYGANATGQYELTSSAGELFVPSGSSIIGELSDTDVANPNRPGAYSDDYGLAGLTVGEQVTLELESSTFDTYLQLVDANTGTVIAFNDDGGAGVNSELSFTVESGVEYLVRATSYGANATGQYELTSSAGELFVPSGSSIIGELSDTDVANPNRPGAYSDDYGLAGLTVGEQVTLELESSTFDTYLQLVDANTGTVIAFNDDGGAGVNSELSFTVESGVEYLVRATSYGANATGQYELTSSAGELFVPSGSSIIGELSDTDVANPNRPGAYSDDYGLAGLTVGEQVTLELESSTFDTYLQLVDANTGTVIAFNDDGGAGVNSELSFTVESGVEYLVRATSYGANATGQYELTSSAGELFVPSGSSIIGELSDTDVANPNRPGAYSDDYGLAGLTVGEQVTLELESSTFDTYLQLVDANTGTVIAFNDDGGAGVNSELSFTVESGVEYLVRATSYGANATGQYELTSSAGELSEGNSPLGHNIPSTYLPFDSNTVFSLNSDPDANHTIYLDFDGHTTTGTTWNSYQSSIVTPAYDTDGYESSFSVTEQETIWRVWQRVAEDFAPFEVNVTTEAPALDRLVNSGTGDTHWGVRAVIGGDGSWFGGGDGVANFNSFTSDTDVPAFIFEDNLALGNGSEISTAETISHEVGHTLGLEHDGNDRVVYYRGHGTGETGWAPIMGYSDFRSVTQWSQGEYRNADNNEDDLAIITGNNGFDYRTDDYGDSLVSAAALTVGGNQAQTYGIIETNTDVDWFSFSSATGAIDLAINAFERGANLDILASLYDGAGQLLQQSNPLGSLSARFDVNLTGGNYFLSVTGTGTGNPQTGYSDYGSLGQYAIFGSIA